MKCPSCGNYIDGDSLFCTVCGTKIAVSKQPGYLADSIYCPFCKMPNDKDAVFCLSCGRDLIDLDGPYDNGGYQNQSNNHFVRNLLIILIIFLVVALAGIGGYIWFNMSNQEKQQELEEESNREDELNKPAEINSEELEEDIQQPDPVTENDTQGEHSDAEINTDDSDLILMPENTPNPPPETPSRLDGDYIIPDSSTRLLNEQDVYGMTSKELNYARNEIYARHGRRFRSVELQTYFDSKSWYSGIYSPDYFDEYDPFPLNSVENTNAEFLRDMESLLGDYQLDQ